ncbi:MAG: hypothetical protein BYD32DRAFT_424281 [Podila humilis]|nr:MAG: hypothetical protein BYD32DRAFT_424281 [Podila humilis]
MFFYFLFFLAVGWLPRSHDHCNTCALTLPKRAGNMVCPAGIFGKDKASRIDRALTLRNEQRYCPGYYPFLACPVPWTTTVTTCQGQTDEQPCTEPLNKGPKQKAEWIRNKVDTFLPFVQGNKDA